jgi:hypothetical protein
MDKNSSQSGELDSYADDEGYQFEEIKVIDVDEPDDVFS